MPTYKEIRSVLLDRIKSGEWRPGVLLPPEAELAEEFGSTRVTVNRAMQSLADDGFVERRRKAGTRVVQRTERDALIRIRIVRDEVEQSGRRYNYLLISHGRERPPQRIQAELGASGDLEALHIVCLHFADGRPFQLENRWINLDVAPQAGSESFETISPNEWLLQKVPYSNAEHTFRAAAVQQLTTWAERAGVPILAQGEGADSASVIYDAVQAARARNIDIVIADTAGRLHTQSHLMDELRKIKRVVQKHDPYAPHEVMLVVDGTTGQNALNQALQFHEAIGLTGITITKLDGTARGGILLAIARRLSLPVRYVGLGEGIDDLQPFDAQAWADAMTGP